VAIKVVDKRHNMSERHAEIGIHEEKNVAFGLHHTRAHGVALASVDGILHQTEKRMTSCRLARCLCGAITARLDHDEHLAQPGESRSETGQGLHGRPDAPFFTESGHNN
jgi:hypothetical protein